MNVLVVGGAGYIGSHAVLDLLENGHRVTVFDNMSSGREENILPEAEFVRGDILSREDLAALFADRSFDAVMHFAALKAAGASMKEPETYARHNISGSLNLLVYAARAQVSYFVFSSSAGVYGDPDYLPIDELHPTNPTNYYGFTKLQVEQQLAWFSKLRGIRYAALRYFNAAGYDPNGRIRGLEVDPHNLIPIAMETLIGKRERLVIFGNDYKTDDGTCIRDYVHVTDLATAHTRALDYLAKTKENLIVNLGTESGHSVQEVVAAAEATTGRKVPAIMGARRDGDPPILVASAAKAHDILNWRPRFSLETMLETTWAVYK